MSHAFLKVLDVDHSYVNMYSLERKKQLELLQVSESCFTMCRVPFHLLLDNARIFKCTDCLWRIRSASMGVGALRFCANFMLVAKVGETCPLLNYVMYNSRTVYTDEYGGSVRRCSACLVISAPCSLPFMGDWWIIGGVNPPDRPKNGVANLFADGFRCRRATSFSCRFRCLEQIFGCRRGHQFSFSLPVHKAAFG